MATRVGSESCSPNTKENLASLVAGDYFMFKFPGMTPYDGKGDKPLAAWVKGIPQTADYQKFLDGVELFKVRQKIWSRKRV